MNLFTADVVEAGIRFGDSTLPLTRDVVSSAGKQATVGVRPEDLTVSPTQGSGLPVVVDLVEELGADGYLYGHSEVEGRRTDVVARVDGRIHPAIGDKVWLTPVEGHVHVFDTQSGDRLSPAVLV